MNVTPLTPGTKCPDCGHEEMHHSTDGCHLITFDPDHHVCPCTTPAANKPWAVVGQYDSTGE